MNNYAWGVLSGLAPGFGALGGWFERAGSWPVRVADARGWLMRAGS
ncbi:MAG: hypothetical protein GX483_05965 [Actinomycetaceae bacterium]|nr:hypothetical protein [Actinomycetaceae bacterium]